MLSEEFDKKVQEAAHHHHPAYDEKAWFGMKKLLDKHLPVDDDNRKRFFFIFLLLLVLGGGALLFFNQISGKNKNRQELSSQTGLPASSQPGEKNDNQQPGNTLPVLFQTNEHNSSEVIKNNPDNQQTAPDHPTENPEKTIYFRQVKQSVAKQKSSNKRKSKISAHTNDAGGEKNKSILPEEPANSINNASVTKNNNPGNSNTPASKEKLNEPKPADAAEKKNEIRVNEEQQKEPYKNSEKISSRKTKSSAGKKSTFFFSASGGADVSYTGNDRPGKMKFTGGAGIGYIYKERLTLRTGFYAARKIYTSSPGEYHGTSWFNSYYPNLQKVDADCKIYEIPVSLSYNFGKKTKHNWFASAGISTFLMKKETYDYFYKYNLAGPTLHKKFTTLNQNKHFFSVLTLSAGYQQNISKKVSVTAEPYFKFPLTGVGNGKVKLNSTGILFTLSVKPFQGKEKK